MKKFLLALLLGISNFSYASDDLRINFKSYIIDEDKSLRLFEKGLMHRTIFSWTCEMHKELKKYIDKYDKIEKFEVYIKNDCSERCQLIVLTFKNGEKIKIKVPKFIEYVETVDLDGKFVFKTNGQFATNLANYPLVQDKQVHLSMLSW